jgi:hypothetical protein
MYHATDLPGWMRFGAYPPVATPFTKSDPEAEKQALKHQAEILQSELDSVKKRLDEIETGTAAE